MADKEKRAEPGFDRRAYLKEIRRNILKNLGLPEDARPEQVMRLLEIRAETKPVSPKVSPPNS